MGKDYFSTVLRLELLLSDAFFFQLDKLIYGLALSQALVTCNLKNRPKVVIALFCPEVQCKVISIRFCEIV